jgi:hypothetical protein
VVGHVTVGFHSDEIAFRGKFPKVGTVDLEKFSGGPAEDMDQRSRSGALRRDG